MLKSKAHLRVDRHSHSLDDISLFPPPTPLGTTLLPDSSHSYTFGFPEISPSPKTPVELSFFPLSHCQDKPLIYGRRSTNSLSLDTLGDEQFLEVILWIPDAHEIAFCLPSFLMQLNSQVANVWICMFCVVVMKMRVCLSFQRHYWRWRERSLLLEKFWIRQQI